MTTLTALFCHARIGRYQEESWFTGCRWSPPYLYVDPEWRDFIDRNWGAAFRELVPALEVRGQLPTTKPEPVKAKDIRVRISSSISRNCGAVT